MTEPTRAKRGPFSVVLIVLIMIFPFLFIGPGVWLLVQSAVGTRVEARVDDCSLQVTGRTYAEYCTGTWTIDGHVVHGNVDGVSSSDEGHTVSATVRGDTAYSTSLVLPLILIGLGLPFLILPYRAVRTRRRRRQAEKAQSA